MNKMTGLEKAENLLGKFKFSEFRIIRELHFYESRVESDHIQHIDLVVESEDRSPNYQLMFKFGGVTGLRLDDFGGGQTRIIGLDIIDITENQWERVSWEVTDFENNAMEFRAKTAEIVSVVQVYK